MTFDRTRLCRPRSVYLGLAAGCLSIVAILLWSFSDLGAGRDQRIRSAAERGDWSRIVSLSDDDAFLRDPTRARFRMRALFRLGRSREAMSILGRLKVEDLQAEDLFLFGKSSIDGGQQAPGWIALEASSKLDPRFGEAVAYMSENRGRRGGLGLVSAQLDRLAIV